MRAFPPNYADPREKPPRFEQPEGYEPPTDEVFARYIEAYWAEFRTAVERYFGEFSSTLPMYALYPYATTVLRMGQGAFIAHKPASHPNVQVLPIDKFAPSSEDWNVLTIQKRLDALLLSFDFRFRSYGPDAAREDAARAAFDQALGVFWRILEPQRFEELCQDLLTAEGISLRVQSGSDEAPDAVGDVYLDEPGRFLRQETWGFEFKHYKHDRPSAQLVRASEAKLERAASNLDVICIVSSGDLTSIGRDVVVQSSRVRVWDRSVVDVLLHEHPELLRRYFKPYAEALARIEADTAPDRSALGRFRSLLTECPSGREHFRRYEDLGVEILQFLFPHELGPPRVQPRTEDGVERRDVVCRNNRQSRFFQRVGDRFGADFIIWDFKNYAQALTGEVINDVVVYANDAVGRLVVVVSRKGGGDSARSAQLRRLKNDKRMVLVVSDDQVLEMVQRRESGAVPQDVLEDLLDELLVAY